MTDRCILQADFSSFRPVSGRRVLQLVFEVAIENGEEALKMLGMPIPGEHRWCAIALLDLSKPKAEAQVGEANGSPKKSWTELSRSNQCGILCADEAFCRYVKAGTAVEAAEFVRSHFKIGSRTELNSGENAARWDEFVALFHLHRDRLK